MSILIKGMEMLTEGIVIAIYKLNGKFFSSGNGTELYPLVPIPSHGRLIDADVLYAVMKKERDRIAKDYGDNDEYAQCLTKYAMSMVYSAPTIIPAEEGE